MKKNEKKLEIKNRAKSFYLASLFFPLKLRNDIRNLYKFCRYIDDIGDEIKYSNKIAKDMLKKISLKLYKGKSKDIVIRDFLQLMKIYNISVSTPNDLIKGVITDLKKVNIRNKKELLIYSYRVAGTVGLMMCKIMDIKDKKLLFRGVQLGIAMQMTNIARDVKEDLKRNRIYFPKSFRSFHNNDLQKILGNKKLKKKISNNLYKLLDEADYIYSNAWNGIINLPFKYKVPIAIASELYQNIGKKIRKKKFNIWDKRIYLNNFEKFCYTFLAIFKILINKKKKINPKTDQEIYLILRRFNPLLNEKQKRRI